jgi:hypothetical protein
MLASRSHLRRADWHVALLMSMLATTVADADAVHRGRKALQTVGRMTRQAASMPHANQFK